MQVKDLTTDELKNLIRETVVAVRIVLDFNPIFESDSQC
jgi:hypothetical protein